ncbi:monofunctional biosynthetic peptidoglycan transglycosylase [Pukyongiella litopenaei]|uniref:Biosynthetic peptidoglycan transglycosylase n=1 Tax=Pukyongiella litopenaei TaxID=2605946 RepID=A0A2S0MPF4_9RHOB|nr:monofunctional biosynthetic peptidoglycan transglycosylase [Pukyongiella litopenaei]AVO37717.1 monofunctional biosynthetic peptidoglycan transglycosylase [Pukyongiella litopenaei]
MARTDRKTSRKKSGARPADPPGQRLWQRVRRLVLRAALGLVALVLVLTVLFTVVNPPVTYTIWSESRRLGGVDRDWVAIEAIAPVMARSAVAAEDANFCLHWGIDVAAVRQAIDGGGQRGASTITQQVVKNVFLWQGRSWLRKALETAITPVVELIWSKRRILEIYLNLAEMGPGVFGVEAAARHHFGTTAAKLSPTQAARIAAILPAPRSRSAGKPTSAVRSRAAQIMDGAATIRADGRAACFED